jgi:hypothetical protein
MGAESLLQGVVGALKGGFFVQLRNRSLNSHAVCSHLPCHGRKFREGTGPQDLAKASLPNCARRSGSLFEQSDNHFNCLKRIELRTLQTFAFSVSKPRRHYFEIRTRLEEIFLNGVRSAFFVAAPTK